MCQTSIRGRNRLVQANGCARVLDCVSGGLSLDLNGKALSLRSKRGILIEQAADRAPSSFFRLWRFRLD